MGQPPAPADGALTPSLAAARRAVLLLDDARSDPKRFGAWVENACLAHAWNAGQQVSYWREEPLEVDGVFEGSWGKWAVEVKTGGFQMSELKALLELVRRHPELRQLVICDDAGRATAERAGRCEDARGLARASLGGARRPGRRAARHRF